VRLVHVPTGTVVIAGRRRSRSQNLKEALDRLIDRIEERERERSKKPRIRTKKPSRVRESILREKKHRSTTKKLRRKVRGDEDA